MPDSKRQLLSRKQMLEEFGIADSTERKHRGKPGWIPYVLVGSRVHYRRASVDQWLTEQETSAEVRDA